MSQPNRAYLEALLEGVPLPATKQDLIQHTRRDGSKAAAKALKGLPAQRYASLEEVGEQLAPVQPAWPQSHRVPRPESDLPPGGAHYGAGGLTEGRPGA